ncbi:FYVE, RhoGEF and PH domain-containing protein 6, partial [Fragariocoptes setiger]
MQPTTTATALEYAVHDNNNRNRITASPSRSDHQFSSRNNLAQHQTRPSQSDTNNNRARSNDTLSSISILDTYDDFSQADDFDSLYQLLGDTETDDIPDTEISLDYQEADLGGARKQSSASSCVFNFGTPAAGSLSLGFGRESSLFSELSSLARSPTLATLDSEDADSDCAATLGLGKTPPARTHRNSHATTQDRHARTQSARNSPNGDNNIDDKSISVNDKQQKGRTYQGISRLVSLFNSKINKEKEQQRQQQQILRRNARQQQQQQNISNQSFNGLVNVVVHKQLPESEQDGAQSQQKDSMSNTTNWTWHRLSGKRKAEQGKNNNKNDDADDENSEEKLDQLVDEMQRSLCEATGGNGDDIHRTGSAQIHNDLDGASRILGRMIDDVDASDSRSQQSVKLKVTKTNSHSPSNKSRSSNDHSPKATAQPSTSAHDTIKTEDDLNDSDDITDSSFDDVDDDDSQISQIIFKKETQEVRTTIDDTDDDDYERGVSEARSRYTDQAADGGSNKVATPYRSVNIEQGGRWKVKEDAENDSIPKTTGAERERKLMSRLRRKTFAGMTISNIKQKLNDLLPGSRSRSQSRSRPRLNSLERSTNDVMKRESARDVDNIELDSKDIEEMTMSNEERELAKKRQAPLRPLSRFQRFMAARVGPSNNSPNLIPSRLKQTTSNTEVEPIKRKRPTSLSNANPAREHRWASGGSLSRSAKSTEVLKVQTRSSSLSSSSDSDSELALSSTELEQPSASPTANKVRTLVKSRSMTMSTFGVGPSPSPLSQPLKQDANVSKDTTREMSPLDVGRYSRSPAAARRAHSAHILRRRRSQPSIGSQSMAQSTNADIEWPLLQSCFETTPSSLISSRRTPITTFNAPTPAQVPTIETDIDALRVTPATNDSGAMTSETNGTSHETLLPVTEWLLSPCSVGNTYRVSGISPSPPPTCGPESIGPNSTITTNESIIMKESATPNQPSPALAAQRIEVAVVSSPPLQYSDHHKYNRSVSPSPQLLMERHYGPLRHDQPLQPVTPVITKTKKAPGPLAKSMANLLNACNGPRRALFSRNPRASQVPPTHAVSNDLNDGLHGVIINDRIKNRSKSQPAPPKRPPLPSWWRRNSATKSDPKIPARPPPPAIQYSKQNKSTKPHGLESKKSNVPLRTQLSVSNHDHKLVNNNNQDIHATIEAIAAVGIRRQQQSQLTQESPTGLWQTKDESSPSSYKHLESADLHSVKDRANSNIAGSGKNQLYKHNANPLEILNITATKSVDQILPPDQVYSGKSTNQHQHSLDPNLLKHTKAHESDANNPAALTATTREHQLVNGFEALPARAKVAGASSNTSQVVYREIHIENNSLRKLENIDNLVVIESSADKSNVDLRSQFSVKRHVNSVIPPNIESKQTATIHDDNNDGTGIVQPQNGITSESPCSAYDEYDYANGVDYANNQSDDDDAQPSGVESSHTTIQQHPKRHISKPLQQHNYRHRSRNYQQQFQPQECEQQTTGSTPTLITTRIIVAQKPAQGGNLMPSSLLQLDLNDGNTTMLAKRGPIVTSNSNDMNNDVDKHIMNVIRHRNLNSTSPTTTDHQTTILSPSGTSESNHNAVSDSTTLRLRQLQRTHNNDNDQQQSVSSSSNRSSMYDNLEPSDYITNLRGQTQTQTPTNHLSHTLNDQTHIINTASMTTPPEISRDNDDSVSTNQQQAKDQQSKGSNNNNAMPNARMILRDEWRHLDYQDTNTTPSNKSTNELVSDSESPQRQPTTSRVAAVREMFLQKSTLSPDNSTIIESLDPRTRFEHATLSRRNVREHVSKVNEQSLNVQSEKQSNSQQKSDTTDVVPEPPERHHRRSWRQSSNNPATSAKYESGARTDLEIVECSQEATTVMAPLQIYKVSYYQTISPNNNKSSNNNQALKTTTETVVNGNHEHTKSNNTVESFEDSEINPEVSANNNNNVEQKRQAFKRHGTLSRESNAADVTIRSDNTWYDANSIDMLEENFEDEIGQDGSLTPTIDRQSREKQLSNDKNSPDDHNNNNDKDNQQDSNGFDEQSNIDEFLSVAETITNSESVTIDANNTDELSQYQSLESFSAVSDDRFKSSLNHLLSNRPSVDMGNKLDVCVTSNSTPSIQTKETDSDKSSKPPCGASNQRKNSTDLTRSSRLNHYYKAITRKLGSNKNTQKDSQQPATSTRRRDSGEQRRTSAQYSTDSDGLESDSDVLSLPSDQENIDYDDRELVQAAKKCSKLYKELERIIAKRAAMQQQSVALSGSNKSKPPVRAKTITSPTQGTNHHAGAQAQRSESESTTRDPRTNSTSNVDNDNDKSRHSKDHEKDGHDKQDSEILLHDDEYSYGDDNYFDDDDADECPDDDSFSTATDREYADQVSLSSSSMSSDSIPEIKMRRNLQKLYHVANEICSSEAKFVDTLRLLNEDFRAYVAKSLPDESINAILRHLPPLQALNQNLLDEFKTSVNEWPRKQKIAHVLVKIGPFLKNYSLYIRDFENTCALLDENLKRYSSFNEKVREFEASDRCAKLTIHHHMLKPIQRIPQYRLLLQQYLQHLRPDHVDYEDTITALDVVSRVAEHANQSMCEGANFAKLLAIQSKLVGHHEIVRPGRLLIKEGELMKICRKGPQPRYFALLSDSLLYLTQIQTSDLLYLNNELPLTGMRVATPVDLAPNQASNVVDQRMQREFCVYSCTRSFALLAKTQAERDEWVQVLTRAIDENLAKLATFTQVSRALKQTNHEPSSDLISTSQATVEPTSPANTSNSNNTQCDQNEQILLGQHAPVWTPDNRVTMCQLCTSNFSALFRRHHCRCCGYVVCSACSANKAPLLYLKCRAARVCDRCYATLRTNIHLYLPGAGITPSTAAPNMIGSSETTKMPADSTDQHFLSLLKLQFSHTKLKPESVDSIKRNEDKLNQRTKVPKVLREVCANDAGSLISGYLWLRDPIKLKWKRQWFIIKDYVLYSYKACDDIAAKRSLPLLGYQVSYSNETIDGFSRSLLIELRHESGYQRVADKESLAPKVVVHTFRGETVGAVERWMEALKKSVVLPD